MTGVVHVLNLSATLPHDQDFYDRQAQGQQALLLGGRLSPARAGERLAMTVERRATMWPPVSAKS